jgi:O-antigen/teichoic acid export membrane protein
MSSTSKSAFYTFLVQIPTQIFGIIAGIFITRMIGAEGRGLYAIFHADLSLFTTLLGFSISTTITYYIANKKLTEEKVLGITFLFSLITIIGSILILLFWINLPFADLLFPEENLTLPFILLFVLYILMNQINTVYSAYFQGAKKFKVINRVMLVNSILNVLIYGIAFTLHYTEFYLIGLYDVLFIGLVIILINVMQWHYHYIKEHSYNYSFKLSWAQDVKPFFTFMGLGHLSGIINFFNYRLVLWILVYYLDNEQVGYFSLAFGLTQMLTFVSNPLAQVLFPVLCSEEQDKRHSTFVSFSRAHFSVLMLMSFVGLIIAPFLIPLLYGSEFYHSTIPFQIILIPTLFSCQTKIFTTYLFAEGRINTILWATVTGFLCTLAFNFILIKNFGIEGAAVSTSITFLGIFFFIYIALLIVGALPSKNLFILTPENINDAKKQFKARRKGID